MLTPFLFALTLLQCPTVAVRQQADTLLTEANRSAGPRKTVVRRLAQRLYSLCPTTGPVPVPVPVPVLPGPTPPPAPVQLQTPTGISPGSSTAPGPVLSTLTPAFSWGAVSGATGYIVAIRDVAANAIVYPSTTGVGPPIAGTAFTLPAGVLAAGAAYRWDLTAVNATSKSLASQNRYFTTAAAPAPAPTDPSVAELPRSVPDKRDPYPGRACTVTVSANVNAALAAARGGQVVCLTGGQYPPFTLPARAAGDTGKIVVRAAALTVPEGTRMTAGAAIGLPRIVISVPGTMAITTAPGTFGWYLAGIEVTMSATASPSYALVQIGDPGATTVAALARDITLARMWIHGTATATLRRCVSDHSINFVLVDSEISDCHENGSDSQAIWGGNGPGPTLIENNLLMGGHENIMFGGYVPAIAGLTPSDITIRRNYIYTPISWKGVWDKKTPFELKNAARVLLEANVIDGSWTSGQTGWAMILRDDECAWCYSRDITIRRNLIRNVGAGVNIAAPLQTNGTTRIVVTENLLEVGAQPGEKRGFMLLGPVKTVTLSRNVLSAVGYLQMALLAEGSSDCRITDNVWASGEIGVGSSGVSSGTASLTAGCGAGHVFSGNTLIGNSWGLPYPAGTTWLPTGSSEPALAATIRALVSTATAGVVVPP